jgi:hypothetical protein
VNIAVHDKGGHRYVFEATEEGKLYARAVLAQAQDGTVGYSVAYRRISGQMARQETIDKCKGQLHNEAQWAKFIARTEAELEALCNTLSVPLEK